MGCERYEAELTDAAIGSPVSPDLERHLAVCVACRSRLEGERWVMENADRGLRNALRIEPSPGFEARLLVAARRAACGTSGPSWWLPGWTAAAAAGLGLLLVWGWLAGQARRSAAPLPPQAALAPPVPKPGPREGTPVVAVGPPRRAIRPGASPREPEVLVPPGREQALAQFVLLLRDPRVAPPKALTEATDPETPLPDLEPLEILDLEPRAPSDTVELDGRSQS